MSRSPSPASSLDFLESDPSGSEAEYNPSPRRRGPPKKRGGAGVKKAAPLKINLSALQRARDLGAAHPTDGVVEDEDGGEEEYAEGAIGEYGVDFSAQELKDDHAIRPLWVDDIGNMYVANPFAGGNGLAKDAFVCLSVQHPGSLRDPCITRSGFPHRYL